MLNFLQGAICKYGANTGYAPYAEHADTGANIGDMLICQAKPSFFKNNASDIEFEYSFESGIKNKKNAVTLLEQALTILLENPIPNMPNPFKLNGKKLKLKNNRITIRVGSLEKDVKNYFKQHFNKDIDINKFKANSPDKIESLTRCRKKSNGELETVIFIDSGVFVKKDNLARLLVIFNHELGGHLPGYLDNNIHKDRNVNEYSAYKNGNKRLAKIINILGAAEGTPSWFTDELMKLLDKEIRRENLYKSRSAEKTKKL